ncbi:MAG: A/G-specific adenine glycosylase [Alphaproteobacteria bacterium]|nr:A/G-specific adenine glycosylase [Alphaproteobacteria bacterium]
MTLQTLQQRLLAWYDTHQRELPWRAKPGEGADPYHVWLSENMLQQTTVAAVKDYYLRFLQKWPTVEDLARADLDEVMREWAGLGYYARARNLHKCAQQVAQEHGGEFPDTEDGLLKLPGIGPYTAAAVAAIAFDRHTVVMDGNIERVMARLFAVEDPLPGSKPILKQHAAYLAPKERCGDYSQALMDLGATICTPKSPKCLLCPLEEDCRAHAIGIEANLPAKTRKTPKPTRRAIIFWLERDGENGPQVLVRRRPEEGLLGAMMEFPSTPWDTRQAEPPETQGDVLSYAPALVDWREMKRPVEHTFTHFHLELTIWVGRLSSGKRVEGQWADIDRLSHDHALPSVMKKVARAAIGQVRTTG